MQGKGTIVKFRKEDFEKWMAEDAKNYLREMLRYPSLPIDIKFTLGQEVPEVFVINYEEELSGLSEAETVGVRLMCSGLSMLATRHDLRMMQYEKNSVQQESPFAFLIRHRLKIFLLGDYKKLTDDVILPPARAVALTEFMEVDKGLYKSYIDWLRPASRASEEKHEFNFLRTRLQEVMEGEVRMVDTLNYVYKKKDGTEMPVTGAASSVRELTPLQFLVENTNPSRAAVLLEEPETNLHAQKQRDMAEIVSLLASAGTQLQITTHSDYFLRRINELIILGNLKNLISSEDFKSLCSQIKTNPNLAFPEASNTLAHYLLKRREDGTTEVKKDLDVEKGLSFEAFKDPILKGLDAADILEEFGESYARDYDLQGF